MTNADLEARHDVTVAVVREKGARFQIERATLLANPEKSCRHSSDYHRLDNARSRVHQKRRAEPLPSVWSAHGCERESR